MDGFKSEKFYTDPPFSYRPSVAEYFTTFKVSKNGIIADILHLDKKKKIEIENYFDDGFQLKLKEKTDLNDNEIFLWNFLEKKQVNGKVRIKFSMLNELVGNYEAFVIGNTAEKFGSFFSVKPKSIIGFTIFGFIVSLVWGFVSSFFAMPAQLLFAIGSIIIMQSNSALGSIAFLITSIISTIVPFIIVFYISRKKINDSPIERKFLWKEIVAQLVKIEALFSVFLVALISIIPGIFQSNYATIFASYVWLSAIIVFGICVWYYYYFGKIAYKFFYWLFETQEASTNRKKWLEFKEFLINYSELEEKPVKYYELWDEFYYYALAVGAIKKP